ncbi:dipeptide ABC transporter ATP-binding protein [Sphingomonas sp. MMS24-J13]|uniref:dipeptide ABC transporter ATP-binding protein n=1 Tax=Sphingomonas sp. MMS24-J13 TaxID=3238686 RepID=UPI00384F857B
MSLLAIDDLAVRYGAIHALEGVSLTVERGEVVALVGASGSGKSTLAHAIPGLLPDMAAIGGTIRLDGTVLDEPALRDVRGRRIGMVFQEPATALNPAMSIGRQIGEVLARHTDLSKAAIAAEVVALLARVGLELAPSRYPHSLSGGQRQRVAIAIAIAAAPELLIADEPTASLDPIAQAGIVDLLGGLVREREVGLLLVSHDLALVADIADRLVVLDGGTVAEQGDARLLLGAPQSPALRAMTDPLRAASIARASPQGEPILQVSQVSRLYGAGRFRRAASIGVAGVNLTLRRGETLGVIGESGSGKSTLAQLVLGLDRADAGIVTIAGQPWLGARGPQLRAMRRQIQAVFQDPAASFDPRQTVRRIVSEPLHLRDDRPSQAEREALVAEVLAQVGLPADAADRLPSQFSGGQRQRIAIARALILKPAIMVLDEALTALDMGVRAEIVALLLRLQADLGIAYLFISHDLRLVRGFADRVLVMRGGRVVEEGAAGDVLERPRDPYTAALVAATPDSLSQGERAFSLSHQDPGGLVP